MSLREISTRSGGEHPPDLPKLPSISQFRGCLLGCALGDIIGAWAERRPSEDARDFAEHLVREVEFSSIGTFRGMRLGQYTDDTQLSREFILSLIDEGEWNPEDFADRIARIFARDGVVGYGGATQEAAVRLIDGASWKDSGTPPPRAGNGAAMRAPPMGLFYWDDVDKLVVSSMEQAVITHKAPLSVAGAVAVAAATAMCLNASKSTSRPHERGWWSWLSRFVRRQNDDFADDIDELVKIVFEGRRGTEGFKPGDEDERRTVAKWVLKEDDPRWSGVSPWARTSVLWALYCVMAHPSDPWKAIELAIWVGGDTDTMAAMAGAMVGAHVGIEKFPEKVMEEVVPLIHDTKAEEYDWNGLDRLVYYLYAHVVRRHNDKIKKIADDDWARWQTLIDEESDEKVMEAMREQQQKDQDAIFAARVEPPEYVRATPTLRVVEDEPDEPEDEEEDGGEQPSVLDMFSPGDD